SRCCGRHGDRRSRSAQEPEYLEMGSISPARDSTPDFWKDSVRFPLERPRAAASVWKRADGEGCCALARTIGAIYSRPVEPGQLNFERGHWARREFSQPVLYGPVEGVVRGLHLQPALLGAGGYKYEEIRTDAHALVDQLHVLCLPANIHLCGLKLVRRS